MSNPETFYGNTAEKPTWFRVRKRFFKPERPEGFWYGFVFRLVYCLVSFIATTVSVIILVALLHIIGFHDVSATNAIFVCFSVVTYCIPVFLGEVLRRRILDLVEQSDNGSITVEISIRGLNLDNTDAPAVDGSLRSVSGILSSTEVSNYSSGSAILRDSSYSRFGKRIFDLVLTVLMAPIVFPVIVIIAMMILFLDGRPVFFRHQRLGKEYQPFMMWKFRTMRVNAEYVLARTLSENPEMAREWSQNSKLQYDPRLSRTGRILRMTSLDELPQVFNVIAGHMSFVGPRPMIRTDLARYTGNAYRHVRPGVTGLWQVYGRGQTTMDERAKMDDLYGSIASFTLDCKIIVRTAISVLVRTGI